VVNEIGINIRNKWNPHYLASRIIREKYRYWYSTI